MNLILVFHHHDYVGSNTRMAPSAYYMDADYIPVAVRIYAEVAPSRDAKVDIFDDGVSVFENRASTSRASTGIVTVQDAATEAILMAGENSADLAGNLKTDVAIEEGSWIYCNLVDAGGGKNFMVQLELTRLIADEEPL